MAKSNITIYFGYGSNLWRQQMEQRCPHSEYKGVARLNDYKWLINERGYANVVETSRHTTEMQGLSLPSAKVYEDEVWGLVYTLQHSDEAPSAPKREYIYRMNKGIDDAVDEGVPEKYVEKVMRKFIPESGVEEDVVEVARKQAVEFEGEE